MARQNYSVARVKTRTQESVGKFERHIERKNEHYANMNVDLERVPMNVQYKGCGELTYNEMLQKLVDEGKISMRGLKKDAKVYDELIFDINSEYFEEHGGYEFAKAFYEEAYYFAEKLYGKDNILSAVMHADEINLTLSDKYGYPVYHYHMHVMALPVVEKKVLWSKRCKDKSLIGTVKEIINQISHSKKWKSPQKLNEYGEPEFNEKGKPVLVPSYSILQDQFYEHMQKAGFRDFERGVRGSTAQNKTDARFQAEQDKKRLAAIQEKIEQANEELSTILPVKASAELIDNMGKKTLTGKIQMSGEDYTYLTNLAKECLVNRRDIYFLESSLRGYKSKLAEVRSELAELKSKCKPFLEALTLAPKKVMEFIERIIKPRYKPVPQKKVLSDPYVWNIAVDPSKIATPPEQTKPKKKNKGGRDR
ncbi:MAG: plasmid recombination protein [Clostridia bacterium]|nr:plasmid recombination protein [Clostridia bacterium]